MAVEGSVMRISALGSGTLTRLTCFMKWSEIEDSGRSRAFVLRKIDLLRGGYVPLRGGVFWFLRNHSHKP